MRKTDIVIHARELRKRPTWAENRLWQKLRGSQLEGLRFRRQEPIGPFIVDFFCAAVRPAIELDGDSHVGKEEHDAARERYLEAHAISVLRFSNVDVKEHLQEVIRAIYQFCFSAPD